MQSSDCAAVARATDPATSHAAAAAITSNGTAETLTCLILGLLPEAADGLCASEMAVALGYPRDSLSPRIRPLVRRGLVEAAGSRIPAVPRVRRQTIWRITETGRELLEARLRAPALAQSA